MSDHDHQNPEETPLEEVVLGQSFIIQAIINVLEKKGLLTREEVFEEFQQIQEELEECDCGCDCDCGGEHGH